MEFIKLIHEKINWALVGAQHPWYHFDNDSSEMIIWYLIDFDPFCNIYEIVLYLLLC